jgi:uncharacterized membrane protein YfcA
LEIVGYISFVFVGITLGLIGGGGSILTVPILVYLFNFPADVSTSYSLFLVGASALFGAYNYHKQNLINYKTGALFAVPAFLGVFLVRKFLMPTIPANLSLWDVGFTKDQLILVVFSLLMLLASVSMIKGRSADDEETKEKDANLGLVLIEGLVVGAVTGFVGAGGGFLIIPALIFLAGLKVKVAIGTSLVIIAVKSLLGFTGDLGQIFIDWPFLISVSALSSVGIILGVKMSKKIKASNLKKIFGYFVLAMGLALITNQLLG